jgi:transcriptional regulator with XRE-family HTH domain
MKTASKPSIPSAYYLHVVKLPRLREVRVRKNFSQRELADKAGLSPANLSRIESGLQEPYTTTIRKLARALGVKPADLMGATEAE